LKDYSGLYTEDISRASKYRHDYLESVKSVISFESAKKEALRSSYITREDLYANREKYLLAFEKLIGSPLFDRKAGSDVQKIFVACDGQGYIYRLVFTFEKGIKFYGLLFVPYDVKEPRPIVVALHGGDGTPELCSDIYGKNYYSHMTRRLLDKGVIVFAPQLLIWDGKRFGDKFERFEIDAAMKMLGGSATSFETECIMGALDALCCFDFVDDSRVGIMGLSYGAYFSMMTAVRDERIKAVYSSCVFNDRMKYPRPDFAYYGASDIMLDAEMAALIYPRALYIEAGVSDCFFGVSTAESEFERLKAYYLGAPEKLVFKKTDMGHMLDQNDDGIDFLLNNI